MKLKNAVLTVALAATAFIGQAHATGPNPYDPFECQAIQPKDFAQITTALNDLHIFALAAKTASNGGVPGAGGTDITANTLQAKNMWAEVLTPWRNYTQPSEPLHTFNLSVDALYNTSRTANPNLNGSLAPYIAWKVGLDFGTHLDAIRYWSSIGIFYNRSTSPQANLIVPATGKTVLKTMEHLYAQTELISLQANLLNAKSVACMKALNW